MAVTINASTSAGLVNTADTSGILQLQTNGTAALTVDTSQNVGIGLTPNAWSGSVVLQMTGPSLWGSSGVSHVSTNTYFDGTNYKYIATNFVTDYYQLSGTHVWRYAASGTAGTNVSLTEAMRIDSSGNVGIGTNSPTAKLDVLTSINVGQNYLNVAYDIGAGNGWLGGYNATYSSGVKNVVTGALSATAYQTGNVVFYTNASAAAGTTASERMRIDSSGNLLVGQTVSGGVNANAISIQPAQGYVVVSHVSGTASGSAYQYFAYNGPVIGSITQSGTTAVLYNVTSDQRLKENIQDADSASALIDSLKVRQFDWKTDNTHQRYGFIAQELVTVAPEAVHQPTNEEDMMAVDYSKLVPMLVKEIQSLRTRLTALETP